MNTLSHSTLNKLNALLTDGPDNLVLSTEAICLQLGLSRSQLHRVVKEHTQLSVTLYLRQKRVERARQLLLETDMRVSEIAYAVGIDSPQNFSKYFIQAFGISATDFRKQAEADRKTTLAAPMNRVSVAVLPFVNMSSDPSQEYFSDGITEEIINVLSHVPNLNVVGRTSSFTFKNTREDLRTVGRQLNVAHVLEGSVRRAGDMVRITAQLTKVDGGYHVWSEKFDRPLTDIFDIQDQIALAILKEIKIRLLGQDSTTPLKRYTSNTDAYLLYLHGRFYHNKFAGTAEYIKAIEYFRAALTIDPTYAIAYAGIASCYLNLWFYRHLPPEQCLPHFKEATGHALQVDSYLAESHLALARMQMLYEWDLDGAASSFQKALEINWQSGDLYGQYALYWSIRGNHIKAAEQLAMALSLEPFLLINNFYAAYVYWAAGNFEEAVAQGRRLIALEPTFWGGHCVVGLNLITLKQYAEAQQEIDVACHLSYTGLTLSACGVLFALSGEVEKAREMLEQMTDLSATKTIAAYDTGIVHACLGDMDTACTYFQTAIDRHEPSMLFFDYIVRDWLPKFRHDPRYKTLMKQIPH